MEQEVVTKMLGVLRERWFGLTVVSLILYFLGFTFGLFLIPLQVIFEKYKGNQRYYASVIIVVGIVLYRLYQSSGLNELAPEADLRLLSLSPIFEALALVTMLFIGEFLFPKNQDLRFAAMFGAGALISAPFIIMLTSNPEVQEALKQLLAMVFNSTAMLDLEMVTDLLLRTMLRTFGLGLFLGAGLVVYLGKMFGNKVFRTTWRTLLADFHVRNEFLWVLIAGWVGALLDVRFDLGILGILSWNVALGVGLLYAMQGLAIIQAFYNRRGRSQSSPLVLFLVFLVVPGINGVVVIGLPLIGISENWIRYTSRMKENKE